MLRTELVEKIKRHILCSAAIFRNSCRSKDNAQKYGTAGQATDENTIRRMRIAFGLTKATHAHSEYVIYIAFPLQQWLRKGASVLR
jgi:hypothetical protein